MAQTRFSGPVKSDTGFLFGLDTTNTSLSPGEMAQMLIMGPPDAEGNPTTLPQYGEDGALLSVFERTNILSLIPGLVWTPLPGPGVPGGYEGVNGVCLFDPAVVHNRARVFL